MKSETQKITVTIDRREAIELINGLREGVGNCFKKTEHKAAKSLLQLLEANFINATRGIHFND